MNNIRIVSRRQFFGDLATAGALILGTRLLPQSSQATPSAEAWNPDLFLAIEPDGTTRIVAHRSEMGTGIRTALPTIVAEELDADWKRVVIEQAVGDPSLGDQNTDGSRSIVQFYDRMREVGASARQMLLAAAAKKCPLPSQWASASLATRR